MKHLFAVCLVFFFSTIYAVTENKGKKLLISRIKSKVPYIRESIGGGFEMQKFSRFNQINSNNADKVLSKVIEHLFANSRCVYMKINGNFSSSSDSSSDSSDSDDTIDASDHNMEIFDSGEEMS